MQRPSLQYVRMSKAIAKESMRARRSNASGVRLKSNNDEVPCSVTPSMPPSATDQATSSDSDSSSTSMNKLLALPVFGKKKTLAAMVLPAEALPKFGNMKTMGLSDNEALPKSGNMKTTGLSDEEDGLSEKEDDDLYLLGHTCASGKNKGITGQSMD